MSAIYHARLFDADHPTGAPAEIRVSPAGLTIDSAGRLLSWRFDELRSKRSDFGDEVRIEHTPGGEVLTSADRALLAAMRAAAPGRAFAAGPSRIPFGVVVAGVLAVLALLAVTFVVVGIPALSNAAARAIPLDWEREMGKSIVDQIAPPAARVTDPRVTRAISVIVERLATAPSRHPYQVVVVRRPEINALAAPGGHIAVFSGLITFAKSPEELAGVLAHEMEHVERRHVTKSLFQQASVGLLLMILAGDASGPAAAGLELAGELGKLSFSRSAELEADAGGFERAVAARIDPAPLPDILERMGKGTTNLQGLTFLSTHPDPAERARRLRATLASVRLRAPEPLLDDRTWRELQAALRATTPAEPHATGR